jgi:hypothetical protein
MLVLLGWMLCGSTAFAHPPTEAAALLRIAPTGGVECVVVHDTIALLVGKPSDDVSDAEIASLLAQPADQLRATLGALQLDLVTGTVLEADGTRLVARCTGFPSPEDLRAWQAKNAGKATPCEMAMRLEVQLPPGARKLSVQLPGVLGDDDPAKKSDNSGSSAAKFIDLTEPVAQDAFVRKFFRKFIRKYKLADGPSGPSGTATGPSGSSSMELYTSSDDAWEDPKNPLLEFFPTLSSWNEAKDVAAIEIGLPSGASGPSGPSGPSDSSGPSGADDETGGISLYIDGKFVDARGYVFSSGQRVTPEGYLLNEDESILYIDDPDDDEMDVPIIIKGDAVYNADGYDVTALTDQQVAQEDGTVVNLDGDVIPGMRLTKVEVVQPPSAPLADPAILQSIAEGKIVV